VLRGSFSRQEFERYTELTLSCPKAIYKAGWALLVPKALGSRTGISSTFEFIKTKGRGEDHTNVLRMESTLRNIYYILRVYEKLKNTL
jgi:hypothetical protein